MCDTTFTFGQRGSHYFQSPSRREYTRLPNKLTTLLTSAQLQEVHHVALGFEDSFLLTYRDKHGRDHIESQNLPPELTTFLYATNPRGRLTRNIPALRLALGPYNASFLIHDSASYIWLNLPPTLLSALQARIKDGVWLDRPRIVALGADSNFLLITEGHAAIWDLGCYTMLSRMLEYSRTQARGIADVAGVALHAYRYECFIAQAVNGAVVSENVPVHEGAGVAGMKEAVLKDVKEVEERAKGAERRAREKEVVRRRLEGAARRESVHGGQGGERGEVKEVFRAKGRGIRLSLSLSVSTGLAGSFSKMLG
ncbi:hypothetical protein BU23DRAFT_42724 [Bimuria novae-zelandiae CBS 107.79]|uniref:Uncharacterized protein n=1 Tax=Bimuria novae-zelandiae CBS 107.79 TaxID=1447943 RepID=A0A6A5VGM2_9PLEO|nr:hypothetical protein BU23DRAFT_42724 [Bimuria novae-zelandiae CBS 107.79]